MMIYTRNITTPLLAVCALLLFIVKVQGQYNNCNYSDSLSGTVLSNVTTVVEFKIHSQEIVVNPAEAIYNSGNSICLDSGFEVKTGALFDATVNGCTRECIPNENLCEDSCTSSFDDDTTPNGQRFVKFQAVLTFPDSVIGIGMSRTILTINGTDYDVADTLLKYLEPVDSSIANLGTLSRCLCDRNIFLYENSNLIFEEGGIKRRNKKVGGVKSEGGIWSMNYILETQETPLSVGIVPAGATIDDKAGINPCVLVAILDTGLEAESVPDNSLYYNSETGTYICGLEDPGGWNFIDNNDDLSDSRGHGTLVTMSYFNAYDDIRGEISEQQVLTVKVLNDCGEGTTYSTLCGMRYAEKKGAEIINASWGMYQNDWQMQRTIEELGNKQITIVSSAGNRGIALDNKEHFPSGYGADFEYIIEEDSIFTTKTFDHVYEVGGICLTIDYACGTEPINLPLSNISNSRSFLFTEPSRGIQKLIPAPFGPSCEIEGTSYASPQLMAALVLQNIAIGGPVSKTDMKTMSKKIHPEKEQYSYRLKNCQ